MGLTRHCYWKGAVFTALLLCAAAFPRPAAASITNTTAFLDRAEGAKTKDHPRFVDMLAQVHRESPALSLGEKWHLRYLDAWEASYRGDYQDAHTQLQDVVAHSGSLPLAAKASALLMNNESINNRYEAAFTIANQLIVELPNIQDKPARFTVLMNLSQTLNAAGQTDLAIRYARMMSDTLPPGETLCYPYVMETGARYNAKTLSASSEQIERAIDACTAAGQPVVADTQSLLKGMLLIDEKRPEQALVLLDTIAASIKRNKYHAHILYWQVERAQAYEQLGRDDEALKAAAMAIRLGKHGEVGEALRNAYAVLYRIEKKGGQMAAALDSYEHYTSQDKKYLDEVGARALAYQKIQQRVLTRKLESEALNKQNSILKLQRALDAKAVEASRLYITLLLIALASIAFWMLRIKRSQLRFKKLASHDGLTGILNHQHFMNEAGRILAQSEKNLADISLISIDLDHFKQVNDTHGHAMGDEVLRHAVEVCKRQLRASDVFGRLGGEEFGILLSGCSREKAKTIADCIRKAIGEAAVELTDVTIRISASVGLACTSSSGYTLQNLCKDADAALYRAKRAGRNRVVADISDDELVQA